MRIVFARYVLDRDYLVRVGPWKMMHTVCKIQNLEMAAQQKTQETCVSACYQNLVVKYDHMVIALE